MSDSRAWYTSIPNMIDDLDLDPIAFRLYIHFARVCGDGGECWQNTKTLAANCNMSTASVSRAKQRLVDAGLIRIRTEKNGHYEHHIITCVDVWEENHKRYREKQGGYTEKQGGYTEKQDRYSGSTKEEPSEEQPSKKDTSTTDNGRPSGNLVTFEDWYEMVTTAKNQPGAVGHMIKTLFRGRDAPNYGFIGTAARTVGGYGRLTQLVWQANADRPTGDVVRYCLGIYKRQSKEGADAMAQNVEQRNGKTVVKVGR